MNSTKSFSLRYFTCPLKCSCLTSLLVYESLPACKLDNKMSFCVDCTSLCLRTTDFTGATLLLRHSISSIMAKMFGFDLAASTGLFSSTLERDENNCALSSDFIGRRAGFLKPWLLKQGIFATSSQITFHVLTYKIIYNRHLKHSQAIT